MQLVSYSPQTVFLSHSSCITLAVQEELDDAQLGSPLAYFISPGFFPRPFSPSIRHRTSVWHVLAHALVRKCTTRIILYPLYRQMFYCRLALVLEIENLIEKTLHAWRNKESILGAQVDHVGRTTEMRDRAKLQSG